MRKSGSEVLLPDQRLGPAALDSLRQLGRIVDRDQDDDLSRVLRAEAARRLDPVHHRHADIQEDELGAELSRQCECFLA